MRRFSKYLLAMMLPLGVLLVRPLTPAAVLMFGEEIRLSTEPADPRDIFRGDYVTLRFSIEDPTGVNISKEDLGKIEAPKFAYNSFDSPYAYVSLTQGPDGIYSADKISLAHPETGLYLRARVLYEWSSYFRLDYGDYLKRYYVRENTGRELEAAAQRGELTAVAKVWRGKAVLTSLEKR